MERITVRVEEQTLDKLDDRAEIENRTRSEVIRQTLTEHGGSDLPHRVDELEDKQSEGIKKTIAGIGAGLLFGSSGRSKDPDHDDRAERMHDLDLDTDHDDDTTGADLGLDTDTSDS